MTRSMSSKSNLDGEQYVSTLSLISLCHLTESVCSRVLADDDDDDDDDDAEAVKPMDTDAPAPPAKRRIVPTLITSFAKQ